MPPYQLALGLAAAAVGELDTAETALERSVAVDDLPQAWLDIAAVRVELGDSTGAREALGRALRLGHQQPVVAYAAGWLYDRLGDWTDADQAFAWAIAGAPSLAGDPSWADAALATRWSHIVDLAIGGAPESAWEVALMAGDPDRALKLADGAADPAFATAFIRAWEGAADIQADFRLAADASPLDVTAVGAAGRLANHAGDTAEADRYARWADIVYPESSGRVRELRVALPPATADDRAGNGATFHGHFVYRRPLPWNLLVPWLPRLAWE
jgi:tetratricopeptide (TPR) repeat protein